jgi:uncharacterized membrane protein
MLAFVLPALVALIFVGVAVSAWLIFKPETHKRPSRELSRPKKRARLR